MCIYFREFVNCLSILHTHRKTTYIREKFILAQTCCKSVHARYYTILLCRCSDGIDRYRQDWLTAGCDDTVSLSNE